MITKGWLDWTIHIPGPPDKVYSERNTGGGIACHSIVGAESDFEDGRPNRFISMDKTADGRYTPSAAASCMFILRRNGVMIQMYPVTASTWTSGGFEGNTGYWAIEAEGGLFPNYGEPLTLPAQEAFIRLVTEWEAYTGVSAQPGVNILQHSQIAQRFNYAATACASGRYAEAWERIASGERYDQMTPEEREEHRALVTIMGGRTKLLDNAKRGNDFILGYASEQADQNNLELRMDALEALSLSGLEATVIFK